MDSHTKDPDAVLDYDRDWSTYLEEGETITSSTWTVPDGLTEEPGGTHSDTVAKVWISGGTVGKSYVITNEITTSEGRIDDRSIKIKIKNL